MWVQWYITPFLGTKLFRSVGLDLRTMVHVAFGRTLDECSPEYYPPEWLDGHAHTHRPLDDVLGYVALFRLARDPNRRQGLSITS